MRVLLSLALCLFLSQAFADVTDLSTTYKKDYESFRKLDGHQLDDLHPWYDGNLLILRNPFASKDTNPFYVQTVVACEYDQPTYPEYPQYNDERSYSENNDYYNEEEYYNHECENNQECTRTDKVEPKKEWKFGVAPFIFFDFYSYNKVTSEDSHFTADAVLKNDQNSATVDMSGTVLEESDDNGLFKVVKRSNITAAAGVVATANYINSAISRVTPMVGVAPIVGSTKVTERFVKTKSTAYGMGHLPLPSRVETMNDWTLGDKVTYSSQGGAMFMAGIGYGPVTVGATYFIVGTWTKSVQKLDNTKFLVEATNGSLKNAGLFVSATVVSLSASTVSSLEKSVSYLFDTSDAEASDAMNAWLAGDFSKAEAIALKKDNKNVVKLNTNKTQSYGRVRSLNVGIPFMRWSRGSGSIHTSADEEFHPDGSKANVKSAIFVRTKDSRFFNEFSNKMNGFFATHARLADTDGTSRDVYTGTFGYSYFNTTGTMSDLAPQIRNLVWLTGMRKELAVSTPKKVGTGTVELQFLFKLNKNATDILVNSIAAKTEVLSTISEGFLNAYFTKTVNGKIELRDEQKICGSDTSTLEDCRAKFTTYTRNGVATMKRAIAKMKAALAADKREEFVSAYAEFGGGMTSNQFSFQTIFNLLKGRGVEAFYRVAGSEVKKYEISLDWKPELKVE